MFNLWKDIRRVGKGLVEWEEGRLIPLHQKVKQKLSAN